MRLVSAALARIAIAILFTLLFMTGLAFVMRKDFEEESLDDIFKRS